MRSFVTLKPDSALTYSIAPLHVPTPLSLDALPPDPLLPLRAAEAAAKGNQGDISGTSKYPMVYTDCTQQTVTWGTLSWARNTADTVLPSLSVPWHRSYDCGDPDCPVRKEFPTSANLKRSGKKDLCELLDAAFDGGAPVRVLGKGGKEATIRPLVRIDDV